MFQWLFEWFFDFEMYFYILKFITLLKYNTYYFKYKTFFD